MFPEDLIVFLSPSFRLLETFSWYSFTLYTYTGSEGWGGVTLSIFIYQNIEHEVPERNTSIY